MKTRPRPRVLVLAEAANPDWVSVPLVGWRISQALRDVADVHLVTQIRNRAAILSRGLTEGGDFTAIDTEALAAPFHRLATRLTGPDRGWSLRTAINRLSYPWFEHLAWRRFGAEIRAGDFDIVHRVTPVSLPLTSPIAPRVAKAGGRFVLGPVSGGVAWPPGFEAERRAEGEHLAWARGIHRHLPGYRRMLRASSAILVGSSITEAEIAGAAGDRMIRLPENAVDLALFDRLSAQRDDGPLRAVFAGRLVALKGVEMALRASGAHLAAGRMTLDIYGDGPLRAALEEQAAGIGRGVTFHGRVPQERLAGAFGDAHVLVFPSIREFGGGVILEAMAAGVVPIVVDYGGPGDLVGAETGFKVPLGPRDAVVAGLAGVLGALVADRSPLKAKSAACREDVRRRFTWEAKAQQIAAVYDWVLGRRPDRPAFFGGEEAQASGSR